MRVAVFFMLLPLAFCAAESWDKVPPPAEPLLQAQFRLDEEGESLLRFGGHVRSMFESYRNRDFGFAPINNDAWVIDRVQSHFSWEHENDFKLMAEMAWGELQGMRNEAAPPDEDKIDVLQLYAQTRLDPGQHDSFVLRVGRQMLYYGSGRLLAHREGANQRLVHDALRVSWRRNNWSIDALAASPVRIGPDAFDNASRFHQTLLWGLYATAPSFFSAGQGMDVYYLGLSRDSSPLLPGQREVRHTFGTRLFGKNGPWRHNHEFILQTGSIADRNILAGAVSLGADYTFQEVLFEPSLGIRGDLISGGQTSRRVSTFDPLFQSNNYFNEGGFISPSNLYNLNPRLSFQLSRTLSLEVGVNFLWRFDTSDGVYVPPFNTVAGAAPNGERYLGTAYNAALAWDPHPSFDLSLGFTHHEAGPSLTSVGGQSVDYLQITARIEF